MKKVFIGSLACALLVSSMAFAGNGDVVSAGGKNTTLTCPVQYGQIEFQINLSAQNGKIDHMYVFDEANRSFTFTDNEIHEKDEKDLKKDTYYPSPAIYAVGASDQKDSISIMIPAQTPLSDTVTAYVWTYSNSLQATIPLANPAKVICYKN